MHKRFIAEGLRRFDPGWLIALLLPLIAVLSLLSAENLPWTADGLFHTHRIHAMSLLMRQGNFYPRWIPWFHLGYGYPVFNYYAPLGTWLGGLLVLLGINAASAFKLVSAAMWLIGSLGLYGLARRWLPRTGTLLALTLWAYAPARLHEYWIQGSLSHVLATALLPWLFGAFAALIDQPTRRRSVIFAFSVAALLLAHQPTSYLAALALATIFGLLSLRLWLRDRPALWPRLWPVLGALLLSLGLASVFLLPLLLESRYIAIEDLSGNIQGILRENFVAPELLFVQPGPMDHSDLSATIPHTYGLVPALFALLGVAAFWRQRRFGLLLLLVLSMALSILLALSTSESIWLHLPLLGHLRFPWRVLRLGIIPLALLGGASLLLIPPRLRAWTSLPGLLLVIASALPTIYPTGRSVDYRQLSAADMIRYEIDSDALGGTSYNEFRPVWVDEIPADAPVNIDDYIQHPFRIYITRQNPETQVTRLGDSLFEVDSAQPGQIVLRQFYFPGWQLMVDGAVVETNPEPPVGLLEIELPAGKHRVEVAYRGTGVQQVSVLISLASFALGLVLLLGSAAAPQPQRKTEPLPPRVAWLLAAGLLGFALFNTVYIQPQTKWFRQQSAPEAPAAMEKRLDLDFGGVYTLLGYSLPTQRVEAGGTLPLTLFWRAQQPLHKTHGALLQIQNLSRSESWASLETPFVGSNPIAHDPTQFVSQLHQLRLIEDAPPYVGEISVQLIDTQSEEVVRITGGADRAHLPDLIEIHADTQPAEARLNYLVEDRVRLRCASVQRVADQLQVDLYWQVEEALPYARLSTIIHGLDAAGQLLSQGDSLPLDSDFPPALWRSGQTLHDSYRLSDHPAIAQVAVGLLDADRRLSITEAGQPVTDNLILLPFDDRPCR